jgi:Fe2+ or Zn2+ uptake regulation protein
MIENPLCPHWGKETFGVKNVRFPQSMKTADFIFCTSCGKIIGQPNEDYTMIVEAIDSRLRELVDTPVLTYSVSPQYARSSSSALVT